MAGSWPRDNFPQLKLPDYLVTSPATRRYNCLAWAAGETGRRWEPDALGIYYWPPDVPRAVTMESFIQAYGTLGFTPCFFDTSLVPGTEKIALFGIKQADVIVPTHAALQLETGRWNKQIGRFRGYLPCLR